MKMKHGEWKVPYSRWRGAVIEEGMDRTLVMAFTRGKERITVLCPEKGKLVKRGMFTYPYEEPLGEAFQGVMVFRG